MSTGRAGRREPHLGRSDRARRDRRHGEGHGALLGGDDRRRHPRDGDRVDIVEPFAGDGDLSAAGEGRRGRRQSARHGGSVVDRVDDRDDLVGVCGGGQVGAGPGRHSGARVVGRGGDRTERGDPEDRRRAGQGDHSPCRDGVPCTRRLDCSLGASLGVNRSFSADRSFGSGVRRGPVVRRGDGRGGAPVSSSFRAWGQRGFVARGGFRVEIGGSLHPNIPDCEDASQRLGASCERALTDVRSPTSGRGSQTHPTISGPAWPPLRVVLKLF